MISGGEQIRRLLVFYHALREAHEEFVDRTECEIDRESLDWLQRERFDSAMERHRRVLRAVEEMRLEAAYHAEPIGVRCTPEERSEACRLALEIHQGERSAESAVDHLLSDGVPHDVSSESVEGG